MCVGGGGYSAPSLPYWPSFFLIHIYTQRKSHVLTEARTLDPWIIRRTRFHYTTGWETWEWEIAYIWIPKTERYHKIFSEYRRAIFILAGWSKLLYLWGDTTVTTLENHIAQNYSRTTTRSNFSIPARLTAVVEIFGHLLVNAAITWFQKIYTPSVGRRGDSKNHLQNLGNLSVYWDNSHSYGEDSVTASASYPGHIVISVMSWF